MRKRRPKRQPRIIRMQPQGMYGEQFAEKPSPEALAARLEEDGPLSGLGRYLNAVVPPDTIGFLDDEPKPNDDQNKTEE